MRFPPPVRLTAPLVALVFGLLATVFDFQLNLHLDLARHFNELRGRAESSGSRLAHESARLLALGDRHALQAEVEMVPDVPRVEIDGVVDQTGHIIADSTGTFIGKLAAETPLAPAASLINPANRPAVELRDKMEAVISAHPFRVGQNGTGWALAIFDRREVVSSVQADARAQLEWMASAMALLSLALWAVLHFGFANRLGRLADSVVAFGEDKTQAVAALDGGDEVGKLSVAISAMGVKLREREAEQMRLEREVLEISESERQRIGRDLHDGLGQRLTAASMTASALVIAARKVAVPPLVERAEDLGRQLREAIAETRVLAHGLTPVMLADEGLMAALASLAESTDCAGSVRCVLDCPEQVRVANPEVAGHLYRIAQEAVNNALKHAVASEIRIGLERRRDALCLEIDDDGIGFEENACVRDGIGLRVMRYRAKLIGGRIHIGSAPAGGARVLCQV